MSPFDTDPPQISETYPSVGTPLVAHGLTAAQGLRLRLVEALLANGNVESTYVVTLAAQMEAWVLTGNDPERPQGTPGTA
jgi:hypothetical protein